MNPDDYVIAVRTYKRYESFKKLTYKTLEENNLLDRLYIFVADQQEYDLYKKSLDGCKYKALVIGLPTGMGAKKAITHYFPVGQRIFFMDDDRGAFFHFTKDKKLIRRSTALPQILEDGFKMIDDHSYGAFTVGCTTNKLYIGDKPFKEFTKTFLLGCNFGMRNDPDFIIQDLDNSSGDDICLTLRTWARYGGVFVYNWTGFTVETIGLLEGGLQASGDRGTEETRLEFTRQLWEDYMKTHPEMHDFIQCIQYNKKVKFYDLKFKSKPQIKKILQQRNIPIRWKAYDDWLI